MVQAKVNANKGRLLSFLVVTFVLVVAACVSWHATSSDKPSFLAKSKDDIGGGSQKKAAPCDVSIDLS